MSWDIVLFNTRQPISSIEEIDDTLLQPADFDAVLAAHFQDIVHDGKHREIRGDGYTIGYFIDDEPASNTILNLYGEPGLFELVAIARDQGWQIFDTGSGMMIDLSNPGRNGYEQFQQYQAQVMKRKT